MSTLPKPRLRGHLSRYMAKSVFLAFAFSSAICTCYYFGYMLPRRRAYAEFHKTYNDEEHCHFMARHGYLQCVQPKQS